MRPLHSPDLAAGWPISLKLIDYDGMFVPALAQKKSGEVGHPAYQHPQRLKDGTYNAEVDRFSHLVIYTAVHCLAHRPDLWDRYDNGDNLLFREEDFKAPADSPLFQELWDQGRSEVRSLVGNLLLQAWAVRGIGARFQPSVQLSFPGVK